MLVCGHEKRSLLDSVASWDDQKHWARSYGAGVCALLAMMWKPIFEADGIDMCAYAFAAPCVVTQQLGEQLRPFVTSGMKHDACLTRETSWTGS